MSRVVVIGGLAESLINFRGALLAELVNAGHAVTAMAGDDDPAVTASLAGLGVKFESFPLRRNGLTPTTDVRTFLALRRALRSLQPDVVLAYTIKPIIWGGLALGSSPAARFYALVTGLGYGFQGGGLARRGLSAVLEHLCRRSLAHASAVVFQNADNLAVFTARRIVPASRCAVVDGSGVDLTRFTPADLPSGPPGFLAISRLLGEKGLREYAAAAAIVKRKFPEAIVRLVGPVDPSPDGIPLSEVARWQQDVGLEYLGAASDVRPFLRDCHVYVLPSYHEGMPRTVVEAMAVGRPILTTDVPGCRETVVAGRNGYLVPPRDSAALADRMMAMIDQRDQWPLMAVASRQMAEQRFDVRLVNARMLALMGLARTP